MELYLDLNFESSHTNLDSRFEDTVFDVECISRRTNDTNDVVRAARKLMHKLSNSTKRS